MFNFHKQSYFTILNQKLLCNDARAKKKKSFHFTSMNREQICGLAHEKVCLHFLISTIWITHLNNCFLKQYSAHIKPVTKIQDDTIKKM